MCYVRTGQDFSRYFWKCEEKLFPKMLGFPMHERPKKCLSMAKWRAIVDPIIFVELYLNLNICCSVLLEHLLHLARC